MYTDNPMEVYLNEVGKVPPMDCEREIECVRHIRSHDDRADLAEKELIEANLALVVAIAQRLCCKHIYILDLIQTGNDALLNAVQAFAQSSAEGFSSFATPVVEKAILHHVATSQVTGH